MASRTQVQGTPVSFASDISNLKYAVSGPGGVEASFDWRAAFG
jgi:hypothetical protein